MRNDPRPRYAVLHSFTAKGEIVHWTRVGTGYRNPDGTIDAYLHSVGSFHHVRLRELTAAEIRASGEVPS